ncbi:dihydroorotase [Flavobacteriaceae bacterium]|nr:dihydroorotase [Flavobacteriaceae bacterium]MDB0022333.1 dihydroorotase [Flavobacteriaceae bacterium]MDB2427010.1 dihydroorotase [Flavobacteriaceae bacterium]MDB4602225.1 dihydroorotase [Flavobacteriaceae bacterium]MDC3181926.1 dihydroorotase [Flavobacteriaceae bacterium]
MNIILKSAKVINVESKHNGSKQDILISEGKIKKIDSTISVKNAKTISVKNLHVSVGWFDSSVSFGEPGYEERETLINGADVAAKSGFTDLLLNPSTNPVLDNQTDISFIKSKSLNSSCNIHPIGALTLSSESKDLAELYDMKNSGAVGFYDFKKPILNSNLLKTALLYSQSFNSVIMSYPQDNSVAKGGLINEGTISVNYGIKGIPNFAEEIQIARDLHVLEYTGGKLHIPTISTKKSLELIKKAKSKGLNVTCSVAVHNLIFNDKKLKDFDTRFKVLPPLREEKDRVALVNGVKTGLIDMVTSDHLPIDLENKKTDIENAKYGTIGLESIFGSLLSLFDLNQTIEILTRGREIFNIEKPEFEVGSKASLSLFTINDYEFSKADILSKSKNSAFLGMKMKGKPIGVINGNKIKINE